MNVEILLRITPDLGESNCLGIGIVHSEGIQLHESAYLKGTSWQEEASKLVMNALRRASVSLFINFDDHMKKEGAWSSSPISMPEEKE